LEWLSKELLYYQERNSFNCSIYYKILKRLTKSRILLTYWLQICQRSFIKRCSKYWFKTDFCSMTSYFKYFFYFDIEYIKGDTNSIQDFLTWKFLQNRSWCLLNSNPEIKAKTHKQSPSLQNLKTLLNYLHQQFSPQNQSNHGMKQLSNKKKKLFASIKLGSFSIQITIINSDSTNY
jgi:hypothetical protein